MTPRRSQSTRQRPVDVLCWPVLVVALLSQLPAQPFKALHLPDTLGGCADFDKFILNPVMNQVYVWSDRANTPGFWMRPLPRDGSPFGTSRPTTQLLSVNIPSNQVFWAAFVPSGDSCFTCIFDAATNELRTTIRTEWPAHHETRPRAFSCPRYSYGVEGALLFRDAGLNSIDDSILPPPGHSFHQPMLVASGAEKVFALACPLAGRAGRVYVINCLNNQVLGEVQLPGEGTSMAFHPLNNKLYAACNLPWPGPDKTCAVDATEPRLTDSLCLRRTVLQPEY